ncbi:MAG: hypothetical protein IPO27_18680 [Bacteroidetes bacterium]|nr:hypothetical protein [Bacteroidota bacterium]
MCKIDGIVIPNSNNPSDSATASGNYTVEISNSNCTAFSAPTTVTVNAIPSPVTLSQSGTITICGGSNFNISVTNPQGTNDYQWYRNGTVEDFGSVHYRDCHEIKPME